MYVFFHKPNCIFLISLFPLAIDPTLSLNHQCTQLVQSYLVSSKETNRFSNCIKNQSLFKFKEWIFIRMNELIDRTQIPSEYGGLGPSLADSASGVRSNDSRQKQVVVYSHLFQLIKKQKPYSHQFTVDKGCQLVLSLYSRCGAEVKVELYKGKCEQALFVIDVIGDPSEQEQPYSRTIGTCSGPEEYTLKLIGKVPGVFLVLEIMNG